MQVQLILTFMILSESSDGKVEKKLIEYVIPNLYKLTDGDSEPSFCPNTDFPIQLSMIFKSCVQIFLKVKMVRGRFNSQIMYRLFCSVWDSLSCKMQARSQVTNQLIGNGQM
ncbi:hypothetical protein Pst134EA_022735 [Puccinia striiformis f. sp. tritici]|uniref:hypothetical protein n=1 Tax=Puccinia striiformis f. sp. tritici TaxID=168172 RepID=UPI002007EBB7|nr:hypothetical protein Pst134EA_022735 [Puccinia striiformis f. sp. tritici]KAH9445763.1 hypothetical protein Pst134EB_023599 [Puccinia striiformis f. sp. tritici]KAH9455261.1 hypothetical protein Pst134EA_022735 [Puccinia striiformis f. sp. tritici]